MGSDAMIIPSFVQIGSGIQKLIGEGEHRQHGDSILLLLEQYGFSPRCVLPFMEQEDFIIHNSPTFVPILSQMNPTYIFPTHFFNTNVRIILPSMSRSLSWLKQ
jgi:hypothetical protein